LSLAARPLLLAAATAATPEMNCVILNLKVVGFNLRPANVVKVRSLDINDTPAIQTDKMMMLIQLGVEARRRARVAGPGHESEGSKGRQDTVNRHARDLRQLAANGPIKLLSRRMVSAAQDRLKNSAPLGSHRQSAFAMCSEEALHSFLFLYPTHLSEMSICTG
jgi:hypothetical protein